MTVHLALVLAGVLAGAQSGKERELPPLAQVGTVLTPVGDLTQDGVSEVLVTAGMRVVWLVDGRSGEPLRAHDDPDSKSFGRTAAIGDVDGDGAPDYAIRAPRWCTLFSGASGEPIQRIRAKPERRLGSMVLLSDGRLALRTSGAEWGSPAQIELWKLREEVAILERTIECPEEELSPGFGSGLTGLGDVDGDGVGDLAASGWRHPPYREPGVVWGLSGASGEVLWRVCGEDRLRSFGQAVVSAADFDGDGIRDVVVTAPQNAFSSRNPGTSRVLFVSGADGSVLVDIVRNEPEFAQDAVVVGDWNGDGVTDVAVNAPFVVPTGVIRIYSGKDGSELACLRPGMVGLPDYWRFGITMCVPGDVDGDDRPDLLVGWPRDSDPTSAGGFGLIGSAKRKMVYTADHEPLARMLAELRSGR